MTPLEMLQEFQVHYDKVDADSLPRMYPEEVFLFLNDGFHFFILILTMSFVKVCVLDRQNVTTQIATLYLEILFYFTFVKVIIEVIFTIIDTRLGSRS